MTDPTVPRAPARSELVLTRSENGVFTILINRPDVRNCVDRATSHELRAAFHQFEADPELKVAVLGGVGGTFCAGADLTAVGDPERRNDLDPDGGGDGPMGPSRMELTKPLIAAVDGYAVAGGMELALLADLRVIETTTVFGVFCRRWGVPLIDGGTVRLPRVVGLGRALDLILTGRPVHAEEARDIGLANRVVGPGEALAGAQELAAEIAAFPFECVLADRASVYGNFGKPMLEALRAEGAAGVPIVAAEGAGGAAKFVAGAGRHGSFTRGGATA